jgi:hypothetical protein
MRWEEHVTCTREKTTHSDRLENLKGTDIFIDIALSEKIK